VSDAQKILDAHVQFDLARLASPRREELVEAEVQAAFGWLSEVQVKDVVDPEELVVALRAIASQLEFTDETSALVRSAIRSAFAVADNNKTTVAELIPRESFESIAQAAIGMTELREALLEQVTNSDVYSQLMSHVIYQGIKKYLQDENVIARKVPGASALMKIGQSAINTAAPKLEQAVDKQLTAFVNANVQDNIRESRRYMSSVLDQQVLTAVAEELWATNSKLTMGELAALVGPAEVEQLIGGVAQSLDHLRSSEFLPAVATRVLKDFVKVQGDRTVADLLTDLGISAESLANTIKLAISPVVEQALSDGYIESRLRAHYEPFYQSYFA
jgi:hypothetical protein